MGLYFAIGLVLGTILGLVLGETILPLTVDGYTRYLRQRARDGR